jgi:hypothetical protein
MNINNGSFSLSLNKSNRCHLCPQNNATTKSFNAPSVINKQMNVNNYVNNKNKILIYPSLPPR